MDRRVENPAPRLMGVETPGGGCGGREGSEVVAELHKLQRQPDSKSLKWSWAKRSGHLILLYPEHQGHLHEAECWLLSPLFHSLFSQYSKAPFTKVIGEKHKPKVFTIYFIIHH